MLTTQTEVDTLARRARLLLEALRTCLEVPEAVNAAANALSNALPPFEEVRAIDQRLIYTDGAPRCDECCRKNIQLARWRKGNAKMCDEHKEWLERTDTLPSVCEVIRRKPEPKPWTPLEEAAPGRQLLEHDENTP